MAERGFMVGVVRNLAALAVAWLVCGIALAGAAQAQGQDDLARLRAETSRLLEQGKYAQALPIAQRFVELARQKLGEQHLEFARAIAWLAEIHRLQGRLADAEPLYWRSLAILEKAPGPEHAAVGELRNNLAEVYQAQGRLAEAGQVHRRNLAIREKALGPEHPVVAQSLGNLADVYRAQSRFAEAEPLYRRSLAILEKALGPGHVDVGIVLDRLAHLHKDQGRLAEAEPLYRRGLAITEKALGPEHPQVGTSLNNLAVLYQAQGRLAEAEQVHRRSLAIREKALGPEHSDVAQSLGNLAEAYRAQGRFAEAEPLYRRSLAILEKALGPGHVAVGTALNNLAGLYANQGRLAEAEPLFKRDLAVVGKALGPEHPRVGMSLNNLAGLYRDQGRLAEAEPLYRHSLAITEKALGAEHPQVGLALNNLAGAYRDQGRLAEAERLYRRSLAITEKAIGPEHPQVGSILNNLAVLYQAQGRLAEAEPLYGRSLAIFEKVLGPEHPQVGLGLNNLAAVYQGQSRFAEAEPLFRRSLAIREKALGPEHRDVAQPLNNLALLYQAQGRLAEAEPLLKRSVAIREKALGPDHSDAGLSLNNLAGLYQAQGRFADAESLYRRSLAIREKALGPEHSDVAQSLHNLAWLYHAEGRLTEAEPLLRRSLAIREKALGPEHPDVASSLNNLAAVYRDQSRFAEAEPLFKRSLAIAEKALGPEHAHVAVPLDNLAQLALAQRDWSRATDYWRRSTGVLERRAERGLAGAAEGSSKGEALRLGWQFAGLVKMTYRLSVEGRAPGVPAAEMFETAQWALASDVATSLAQMAARSAAGSPQLAALVRERQDLVGEWQTGDKLLIAAKGQEPAKRNTAAEKVLAERFEAIDARLTDISRRLAKDFPDYAALASPAPVSVAHVQAQLGAGEALVLFLDTPAWRPLPEETFVWVVTKTEVRWVRSELGTAALQREVAALRCGLDASLWNDAKWNAWCAEALKTRRHAAVGAGNVLPFDLGRAHALYQALLGEVEDLIKGKHLLIVPSGALTQLPFQVLVTKAPAGVRPSGSGIEAQSSGSGGNDGKSKVEALVSDSEGLTPYRAAAWLGARQPITVLPAVSSLKALRAHAKASRAAKAYLGIGNPLLDGPDARFAELAKRARAMRICPVAPTPVATTIAAGQGDVAPVEIRGGLANVADLRTQTPLPETAEELCAVARDLKANPSEVRLAERATETEVKRLSASGELARYRVLHFATHGTMAGELSSAREPGLILTPPDKASEQDDGYLSASEIGALKLDADWAILSACNTAARGASSAEALSGIARAFIYAGARALLVSHWAVESNATVKLITTAAAAMARDRSVGRAEAMRRAMLALIRSSTREAHPAYWAPFVVVGEGAAAR